MRRGDVKRPKDKRPSPFEFGGKEGLVRKLYPEDKHMKQIKKDTCEDVPGIHNKHFQAVIELIEENAPEEKIGAAMEQFPEQKRGDVRKNMELIADLRQIWPRFKEVKAELEALTGEEVQSVDIHVLLGAVKRDQPSKITKRFPAHSGKMLDIHRVLKKAIKQKEADEQEVPEQTGMPTANSVAGT